jgi:hypothetical protein
LGLCGRLGQEEYQPVVPRNTSLHPSALFALRTPQSPLRLNRLARRRASAYIGAIENGFPRSEQETKMSAYSRISENLLFSVLIAAVIGWTAVSVAAESSGSFAASSVACTVAKIAAGIRHS